MSHAEPDDLRRQMAEIRDNLQLDARGIAHNAREMVDWRYYVRKHPWISMSIAAALGYFAIPRRLETSSPDAETFAKLAKQNRLVVQPQAEAQARKSGLAGSLFSFVGSMLLRTGMTYAGQQVGKVLGQQAGEPSKPTSTDVTRDNSAMTGRPK